MRIVKDWINKQSLKNQLIEVFGKAGLYIDHQTRGGKIPIYPKIHDIKTDDKGTTYVFTIPNGLDPDKVEKKMYCFQQILGKNIKINGDIKRFVLNVYHQEMTLKQYNYDYRKIRPLFTSQKLPIVAGKDEFGNFLVYDMVEHPHILIAGETGSGKSSMLRTILTTLIQSKKASQLQLYLGDLKRSEFHFLGRVEHVKGIYKHKSKLEIALLSLKLELEKRGDLLDELELSHIDDYNKTLQEKLPYIVLCIDEVALLHGEEDVMDILDDIAAAGRALGMFLILSMQRPDAEVLNGRIKSNLTVRMAFQSADKLNSRIILGQEGAEELKQAGEMIIKLKNTMHIQAPYLDLKEAKKIVKPYIVEKHIDERSDTFVTQENIFGVLDDENER
ncbi:FtsK/SpoIIIE domain-containing protein [Bacillus pseudomycoides]|uniref:FtsK/SpoIIIE domain-containing protein n=1 Tax=Bacillus pseudomycoides TaxID=64104 RepID=UPI002FFDB811